MSDILTPKSMVIVLAREKERRAAEKSLYEFTKQAWHVIEPGTPFMHNWHLQVISEHLEAVTNGKISKLIINIPPRHMKSIQVAVMWPVWVWTFRPDFRWLFASYAGSLSVRDSLKCRRLIESEWFKDRWGDRFKLTGDQNAKTFFENDQSGYRFATSVGASTTGHGGDALPVANRRRKFFVETRVELRLVVIEIKLTRRAFHVQIDDALRFRCEVRTGSESRRKSIDS